MDKVFPVSWQSAVDIDDMADFKFAEMLMRDGLVR